jgi:hypothetical protein
VPKLVALWILAFGLVLTACLQEGVDPPEPATSVGTQASTSCGGGAPSKTCYRDSDGDGKGADPGVLQCSCTSGWVDNDNDCDDTDPAVSGFTCYSDRDGDGAAGTQVSVCAASCAARGMAISKTDCDDTSKDRWQYLECYPDDDGDHFGHELAADGDSALDDGVCAGWTCADGTAGWAESAGDCDDDDPAVHPFRAEAARNAADDDCSGDIDEARAVFSATGNNNTSSSFSITVKLASAAELDAAAANNLKATIYYRALANASAGWIAAPRQTAVITSSYASTTATVTLTGLAPLTVYEARLAFYRNNGTFIQPMSCAGAPPMCTNSDAYYTITKPAGSDLPVKTARYDVVLSALSEYGYFRTSAPGSWDTSLQYHYDLESPHEPWCSEFYATSTRASLAAMNPCDSEAGVPSWCDIHESSPAESSTFAVHDWFADADHGLVIEDATVTDVAASKPGDWFGVNATDIQTYGQHSQMFLAYDPAVGEYWFVEGNGSDDTTPYGNRDHTVNVGSTGMHGIGSACPADGSTCEDDDWVKTIGRFTAAGLDP